MTPVEPGRQYELMFRSEGKRLISGLDEVGRGALAGPVVAGAVILPPVDGNWIEALSGVRDSKLCTARQRVKLDLTIRTEAVAASIGLATVEEIDRLGIASATRLAMSRALHELSTQPDALLIDYIRLPAVNLPQRSFPKGDQLSLSIAASSIVAKVARDRMLESLHDQYPEYGFDKHKGYGTADHLKAVASFGPCPIHRLSFSPFRLTLITELHENSSRA